MKKRAIVGNFSGVYLFIYYYATWQPDIQLYKQ